MTLSTSRLQLTNNQNCDLTQVTWEHSFSGKNAVISWSTKDNDRPPLEADLSQLLPCLPWVSMCRCQSRRGANSKKMFSSLHPTPHEPKPNVQASHLFNAPRPQKPPWDDPLRSMFLGAQACIHPQSTKLFVFLLFLILAQGANARDAFLWEVSKCSA